MTTDESKNIGSMSRRNFVGGAFALGALGAFGTLAGCTPADAGSAASGATATAATGEAAAPAAAAASGEYHLTFNGGPLTAAEQHATLSSYDWRTGELSIKEIAEAAKSVTYEEAVAILDNEPLITEDYIQEDGKVIPAVYLMLRNRIHRIGQGVGNEVTDGCWDFLMNNFSEEEAELYLKLPMFQYFNATQASEASGLPYEKASELCEGMSYRGLLNRVTRSGVNFYHTLAFAHGILEFMMDRYEDEGFVTDVFGMLGADYGYQSRNQGSAMYFTIPAQQDVVGDSEILPYCDWTKIIDRNEVIAVSPCQCRTFTPIRNGEKPGTLCDHPMETCISTGEQAQYYIENGIGRQIEKEEAREIIQNGVDAGMVIQIMNTQQCDVICQCHGDCCAIMKGYIALEGDVENLNYNSNYMLEVDQDSCIKCGSCAERCPLFTVTMGEDGYPEIGNSCVRCGQCAIVCPAGARKLVAIPEESRTTLPHDMIADYHEKAIERAKRGYIVDFDPAKL